MSRRANSSRSQSNERPKSKKPKIDDSIPPFSTTEYIKNIEIGDKFAAIIGYVDTIQVSKIKRKTSPDKPELDLFKFVLNNNNGTRVSCYKWGDEAPQFSNQIKQNQIYLLQNVTANVASSYNLGNVNFELQLKSFSKISCFGVFHVLQNSDQINSCDFPDIPHKTGIIKIRGYVKDEFIRPSKLRTDEYIGTITDGEFKIEILISNVVKVSPISAGQRIEIVGDVQQNDYHFFLHVQTFDNIKILDDTPMPLAKLLVVSKMLSI